MAREGAGHPDRNAQFEHFTAIAATFIQRGQPVISVDTKKKELVGDFKNGGREWQPTGAPARVRVHDFPGDAVGKAIPYERIGAREGLFWGHPQGRSYAHLHPTQPRYPVAGLARLREADRYARRAQPAWKLSGRGSVGSQALLGIPVLAQLRDAENLRSVSKVWPFETGCVMPARGVEPRIVFAEIYPSIVTLPTETFGRVKDSLQIRALRPLISPSPDQWMPAVLIGKLRANHADIRSKDDIRQNSGPGDPVHSERAWLQLVNVAREHIPDGRLDQQTVRLHAPL